MRALRLLGLAADAEVLRLKREALVLGRCAVRSTLAVVFAIAALVMLHVAAWYALVPELGLAQVALLLAAIDAAAAGVLLWLAQPRRDRVADEAAQLRSQLLRSAGGGTTLDGPVGALVGIAVDAAVTALRRR
jgi:hypothetical protein